MKYLIRALDREGAKAARRTDPAADEMPAGEAARRADLATTDLESLTDAELQRMLGAGPVCRFAYASGGAAVAAATTPGAGDLRGVIKLHGRLVPMTVRYPGTPAEGLELSGDDVSVVASPLEGTARSDPREAEALLQIGSELEVGYAGFYGCTQ